MIVVSFPDKEKVKITRNMSWISQKTSKENVYQNKKETSINQTIKNRRMSITGTDMKIIFTHIKVYTQPSSSYINKIMNEKNDLGSQILNTFITEYTTHWIIH